MFKFCVIGFEFFSFCLTLSVTEKLKTLIFKMPIIAQTLNINNLITTRAKAINLLTNRKLVEYSFKNGVEKAMFIFSVSEILLSKGRLVLRRFEWFLIFFYFVQSLSKKPKKYWESFEIA